MEEGKELDYKEVLFNNLSTAESGDDGMPTGFTVMAKADCRKMAFDVIKKEQKYNDEEAENYLKQNFNRIWKSHDQSQD